MKSDKKIDVYMKALEDGDRPSIAARKSGLTHATISTYRSKFPDFAQREITSEAIAAESVEAALKEAAENGNVPAAMKWLEKRSADRWAPDPVVTENRSLQVLEAGPRLERIAALMSRLEERRALAKPDPDIIDV